MTIHTPLPVRAGPQQRSREAFAETVSTLIFLHRFADDEVRPLQHPMGASNEPPFLRGQVAWMHDQASGLAPLARSITVAGQHRNLTGFRCTNITPV